MYTLINLRMKMTIIMTMRMKMITSLSI